MAKGKPLVGRVKGNFRLEAMKEAGPGASPETIAKKANEIALKSGYEAGFTPEFIAEKMNTASKPKASKATGGYSISQVLALRREVQQLADKAGGAVALQGVLDVIDQAGGTDAIREILQDEM